MAPYFWLEIVDWKEECDQVNVPKAIIDSYFSSSDMKKSQVTSNSLKSLNYFNKEIDLDINKLQTKFIKLNERVRFCKYDLFKLFSDFKNTSSYYDYSIITSRSILSRIMNTPFEINQKRRKWTIKAELYRKNCIYLYYCRDEENCVSEQMAKQYEMLKRCLFVKYPIRYNRKVIKSYDELFGVMYELKLGDNYLCYMTEIPGVLSDNQVINKEKLNTVEPIYCDIFEDGEYTEDLINYNPIWWSKATLLNAKECIIASYDKNNDCIKNIYKFNIDKFEDKTKYENLWSPDAAWNFLKDFQQFVRDTVDSIPEQFRKTCVWQYQSFANDEPFVSCEIFHRKIVNGKETLTPVDENTF